MEYVFYEYVVRTGTLQNQCKNSVLLASAGVHIKERGTHRQTKYHLQTSLFLNVANIFPKQKESLLSPLKYSVLFNASFSSRNILQ